MDYYIEIKLHPNHERNIAQLMNDVFGELHKRLFEINSKSIGVSFPKYSEYLGDTIRIHGCKKDLEYFDQTDWCQKYKIFTSISSIYKVPAKVEYKIFSREQQNKSNSKLRRLMKRNKISDEDRKKYIIKMMKEGIQSPYIEIISNSNKKRYRRYILMKESKNLAQGEFDFFGLSKNASVPWF